VSYHIQIIADILNEFYCQVKMLSNKTARLQWTTWLRYY